MLIVLKCKLRMKISELSFQMGFVVWLFMLILNNLHKLQLLDLDFERFTILSINIFWSMFCRKYYSRQTWLRYLLIFLKF